jgi:hypothetical protein
VTNRFGQVGAGTEDAPREVHVLKSKWICILLGMYFLSYGCDVLLTQEDVKRSIYTVMRGYEASTMDIQPQVSNRYSNAADLEFKSTNEALVNKMSILIREDNSLTASGTCLFSGYEDSYSGYRVNGELAYDCEKSEDEGASCEFSCNTTLTGGKVKKLEFLLDIDSEGRCAVASVIANGKKIKFNQWAFVTRIVRAFTPHAATGL